MAHDGLLNIRRLCNDCFCANYHGFWRIVELLRIRYSRKIELNPRHDNWVYNAAHNGDSLSQSAFIDSLVYPRATTNYFAIPNERTKEIRDLGQKILSIKL
jgi:hypothetical protein